MSYTNDAIWGALPRTTRGQPIVISTDPKGTKLVYVHGNSVIIRDLEDTSKCEVYTEHSTLVTVAKYAPSGFYICSADQHGKVRLWDTINDEHILKAEYQPLGGAIRDLVWSQDSQRICVAGEGRSKFAHVFMMDTGSSVKGDLSGHSKAINTCDWKPTRPFRIATGAEDNLVAFYEGPPFQFKCTKTEHTRFVQCLRYSPDGEYFASGGFDGKIVLYNGKDAEVIKEFGSPAHKGGIYGVSWSSDSKQLLSSSGDKTCKLWDVESGDCVSHFVIGSELEDQQLSCLFAGNYVVSVALSGFINFLDVNNPSKLAKVVKGHNKPITRMVLDRPKAKLYTCGTDGTVITWDIETGLNDRIDGKGHTSHISGLAIHGDLGYTCGIDDNLRAFDLDQNVYTGQTVSLGCQPKYLTNYSDGLIAVTIREAILIKNNQKAAFFPMTFEPQCVCYHEGQVAIGGDDNKVHVYKLEGNTLTEVQTLEHRGVVTDVSFSPNNQFLAACDTDRKVIVYNIPDFSKFNKIEWGFHNARIDCIAWSTDSKFVASGSLDTMIIVWSIDQPNKHITIKNAHPQSQITGLVWVNDKKFLSAGHDSHVKTWTVSF